MSILDNLLRRKPPAMLGLDVGSASVRLVELDRDAAGHWVLERCLAEPLEKGAVGADGQIEQFDVVVDTIRRVVLKSGTKARQVAAALPASAVIAKKVVLPEGLREDELDQQVEGEAGQYIPFPLEDVSLDYCIMGPSMVSAGDVDVMIVAARRERVDDMQAVMSAAGVELKVLDVTAYAAQLAGGRLVSTLPKGGRDALIALAHVGAESTTVYVMRNDEVLFEREQTFGGIQLTQHIAKYYGMTFEEAEAKKVNAQLPDDYSHVVLQPFMERLAQELQAALQFFYSSTPYHKVDYIMLAGGSAALPKLTEVITAAADVPCLLVNPFDGMTMGPALKDRKLRRDAPGFLTACGLAMRRFAS
ncbi:pilus assembly protein PilM [Brachymonas sp. M4Q-1]|uniref:pilus assembly protein PilM n=1 Tax=Brachymonas sp. M4Q-1 TaxID=3416906 RepID=UPI003CF06E76